MKLFSLRCAMFLAVLAIHSDLSLGQNKAPFQREKLPAKILAFLKRDGEMRKYRATFTGEVTPLPKDLQEALEERLYLHRFTIVRMSVDADITSWSRDLIIVTDAKSGEVVSYAWQISNPHPPESFKQLLTVYPNEHGRRFTTNLQWAKVRIKVLADLLVYPERNRERGIGSRIGSISEYSNGKVIEIRVELIASYHPFRLLIVQMEEIELNDDALEYKYGRLSIAEAASPR